ncbi:helix-turn-helix domain-containing protein [Bordetella petrii]|uniref:helix-turn-helix domain-containing protein n=1 Tax=Bordetella petrii TaxID=94624 RepID=UPI001A96852D|nr:helix-turn-helix transcriptional regulator [Bordetella petrii]MBO1113660.1 helix-turn-helix transcriptional regulator [Bordetella petrii]
MPAKPLSNRERDCLHWSALGKTSWEISVILGVSERTVNFHIGNACSKLGVYNRRAAVAVALSQGLLPALIG